MKVLVLTEDYPNLNGGIYLMYVHTRNVFYKNHGIDTTVLSFSAKDNYVIDGIRVITVEKFINEKNKIKYDVLIIHAANLRHHFRFLIKYGKLFHKYLFFYHGHEVLKINKVYSKPYPYLKVNRVREIAQDIYDDIKLYTWKKYLSKVVSKSEFVFVSKWMYDQFLTWVKLDEKLIKEKVHITYNCVGHEFEKSSFIENNEKAYDFVTIRGNLDGSKYSIDIVNRLANNTPNMRFLVVGKGEFFNHYSKASNITWLNQNMNHEEIINTLQKSRFALMPTRTDSQGLMMCEMAAFGIPVITSDIPVCHEVFDNFPNVFFISNDDAELDLHKFEKVDSTCIKHSKYYEETTVIKEVELIESLK